MDNRGLSREPVSSNEDDTRKVRDEKTVPNSRQRTKPVPEQNRPFTDWASI